jgi:hypothetical protein
MQEKKCPSCGEWNKGELSICAYCGKSLDKNELLYQDRKRKGLIRPKVVEGEIFEIKAEYPWWKKALLYFIRPIYWTFFYIVSAIVWLVATVSA